MDKKTPEETLARKREYYKANKQKILARSKAYYKNNRQAILEKRQKKIKDDPAYAKSLKEYHRAYYVKRWKRQKSGQTKTT